MGAAAAASPAPQHLQGNTQLEPPLGIPIPPFVFPKDRRGQRGAGAWKAVPQRWGSAGTAGAVRSMRLEEEEK